MKALGATLPLAKYTHAVKTIQNKPWTKAKAVITKQSFKHPMCGTTITVKTRHPLPLTTEPRLGEDATEPRLGEDATEPRLGEDAGECCGELCGDPEGECHTSKIKTLNPFHHLCGDPEGEAPGFFLRRVMDLSIFLRRMSFFQF
jgi:hypothetical protein